MVEKNVKRDESWPETTRDVLVSLNLRLWWRGAFLDRANHPFHPTSHEHAVLHTSPNEQREKTKQEADEKAILILLSLSFSFLPFAHLHQPLSVHIESEEIKRKGGKEEQ